MKKIIAAAVAAAFVAPAFAADVSVSGSMAFVFSSTVMKTLVQLYLMMMTTRL